MSVKAVSTVLSLVLALQIGISPAVAQRSQAPSSKNSRIISLLLQSSRETSPERALRALQEAREELKKEGLSTEDTAKILTLIEDLEKKLEAKIPRAEPRPNGEPKTDRALLLADSGSAVARLDQENSAPGKTTKEDLSPELREALWEIGRGRLSRDAQNLSGIITEKTGKTPEQIDREEAQALADAYKPGMFLEILSKFPGLNLDVSKSNLKLKQEFDGVALDTLADKLITDATRFSIPAGALQGAVADIGPKFRALGISGEVLATFVINAKLALSLADLYSVELADSEKEVVLLVVFVTAKIAGQYGPYSSIMNDMLGKFGQTLGRMKFGGRPGQLVEWLKNFSTNKAVIQAAGPALTNGPLATDSDAKRAEAEARSQNSDAASGQSKKPRFAFLKEIAGRLNLMGLLKMSVHGARSAVETYGIGHAAKYIFSAARLEKRAIHNENFRRFLMTPTAEGYFKLMVLAMNDGRPSLSSLANARTQSELKTKQEFIFNLARSARVCSSNDIATSATQGAASLSASAYACGTNPNTARFERLTTELVTYDEIPQEYVTDLRLASREHRLRMAELAVQMQFLDGDRSPSENLFFRHVIAKTLGVDQIEDLDYYDRVHAFIQENGGMIRAPKTPSGFTVRNQSVANPYDMKQGYSPTNSPEPATGPRYLPGGKTTEKTTDKTPDKATEKPTEKPALKPVDKNE